MTDTRDLNALDANDLKAGADHYRAFVGPPKRYDFLGASQFSLLFHLGLREHHKVLDFGCGSLRLGRMLIPFLLEDRYFGIEPYQWLIDDGFKRELGHDAQALKRPRFSNNEHFDCTVFDERFDFIMAQSIVTHAGPDLTTNLLKTAKETLTPSGLFMASLKLSDEAETPSPALGWTYPHNITYPRSKFDEIAKGAGLNWTQIPWHHPGADWIVAGPDAALIEKIAASSDLKGEPVL